MTDSIWRGKVTEVIGIGWWLPGHWLWFGQHRFNDGGVTRWLLSQGYLVEQQQAVAEEQK